MKYSPKNVLKKILLSIILIISVSVMISWFLQIKGILSIIYGSATMKFNTALLFFVASICLIIERKKEKKVKFIYFIFCGIILLVSSITILEHLLKVDLIIDNLFVKDTISKALPGRMSIATSLCFIFLSIGLLGLKTRKRFFKKGSQTIVLLTIIIAFISTITYLLKIPIESKTFFFKTMSIHTSVLFIISALLVALKTPDIGFIKLFLGKLSGSNLLRKIIPFLIFLPFILSYLFSILLNNNIIKFNFGIIIYTVVLILISIIYTSFISIGINKSDSEGKILQDNIAITNKELIQYKEALNSVSTVTIIDINGIIKKVNNNLIKLSKFSEEELIGKHYSILYDDFYDKAFFENIIEILNKGEVWNGELKNITKKGTLVWVSCSIIPFKNKDGVVNEFVVLKQDITQRKEAEALLASQYVKQLEAKNKELEQFTYIASHDLQEPLRTITSFSDIIRTEYEDKLGDQAIVGFKFIKQATGRMRSLIKGLLDYSRLGHEQETSIINCNTILKEITEDLNTSITQTNSQIVIDQLPQIIGYETGIRLLFQNLIANAIKFKQKENNPIIKISAIKKEVFWQFCVEDNGIGIEKEFQKKVFAIFQRLHLKNEYEGTGIGLAHCQKIVSLHGGEIWVESIPQKGSKFYFTILNKQ